MRAPDSDMDLIDTAARMAGQSRSAFMLTASLQRARQILADRTRFELDEDHWRAFHAALEAPPTAEAQAALERLLRRRPTGWEEVRG